MLVPSMNLEEIRKEIDKDFDIVCRKSVYVMQDLLKENRPLRGNRIIKVYDYFSKHKNNWIYKLDLDKKGCLHNYLTYYYNDRGLAGIEVTPQNKLMLYFTTHYFKRYNERLKLGITEPKKLLHTFMHNHTAYTFENLGEVSPGIFKIFAYTKNGVALGTWLRDLGYVKMNTFITHEMLKGNQLEIKAYKSAELDKYLASVHKLD
ncbi:MAG: hypothetical protein POELPBGB_00382 [Bacteroidia bacterium]|nr:hypothetical protein [Bacteroidia bacterium]